MHTVIIASVGKNKEEWLEIAWSEYTARLKTRLKVKTSWLKDTKELEHFLIKHPQALLLDSQGTMPTSEQFHGLLFSHALKNKGRIEIVIGPDMGFDKTLRAKANSQGLLISLSRMTLTHQMCRLLLIEQIYRAIQIELGSPYHK